MYRIKRRQFLQFSASAFTILGLDGLHLREQSWRYAKAIASSSPRKLALLVGINNYQNLNGLKGAIADVNLQRELLIHKFGFNPKDILVVSDESSIKPTRQGILQAFEEHLIKQAKPGDIAVYHFSGHGSQVSDANSGFADNLNSTFVPSDRSISQAGDRKKVSDIMGKTLFLLMSNIKTENLTVVLDSCYSGGGKRGNFTIRSIRGGAEYIPSDIELEYQQRWLSKLGISERELQQRRQQSIAKGIVIASARRNEIATEAYLDGFVAGAFTYLMTQHLWQESSDRSVENIITNISRSINRTFAPNQTPEFEVKNNSSDRGKPIYFVPQIPLGAEAVITEVKGDRVKIWMGGVAPETLPAFNQNPTFQLIDIQGQERGQIELQSRNGLIGIGKVIEIQESKLLKEGAFLQERIRSVPANYQLRIGLDDSLGKDLAAAKTEIAKLDRVKPLSLHTGEIHYIFGRMTQERQAELKNKRLNYLPPVGSFGLYTEGLDLIPGSFGDAKESVGKALNRLKPKLRSLLAARVMKLVLNANSSHLKLSASLKISDGTQTIAAQTFVVRGYQDIRGGEVGLGKVAELDANPPKNSQIAYQNGIPQIPLKTLVQIEVENQEDSDLYITVLVVNASGGMDVVFPNTWSAENDATLVTAGETLQIPKPQDIWQIEIIEPVGLTEVLIVASKSPLRKSLQSLQTIAKQQNRGDLPVTIADNTTNIIDLLLQDINGSNAGQNRSKDNSKQLNIDARQKVTASDTTQLAAMSITYEAVK